MEPKQNITINVNYRDLPKHFKSRDEKVKKIVLSYSSETKLKAVLNWPVRMKRRSPPIMTKELAELSGIKAPRISEFLNLRVEPTEEQFLLIDGILHTLGV